MIGLEASGTFVVVVFLISGLFIISACLWRYYIRQQPSHVEPETEEAFQEEFPDNYILLSPEEAWQMYDRRLAEFEVRAFRAYVMNYNDSAFYDGRARWLQTLGLILLTVSAVYFAIWSLLPEDWQKKLPAEFALALIPGGSLATLVAKGPAQLFPASEGRALKHVEAGSEWFNVHRRARTRRLQLRQMNLANGFNHKKVSRWCNELAGMYRDASKITPISEETYKKYLAYSKLKGKYNGRRRYLAEFMKDLPNSDEPRHMIAERGVQTRSRRHEAASRGNTSTTSFRPQNVRQRLRVT